MTKKLLLVVIIYFIFFPTMKSARSSDEPLKILFIGSSYFNYNNLPKLFKELSGSLGKAVKISTAIKNGLFLTDHVNRTATVEKIKKEKWDFVILQGVGETTAYPNGRYKIEVLPSLIRLRDQILSNWESTKIVFCLPWAYEDGMTWVKGWNDTYDDMQNIINENTLKYARETGLIIAPVGVAWHSAIKTNNYQAHYLHANDYNHPNVKGSYLTACVLYSAVFKENVVGSNFYNGLEKDEAQRFQEIADETVLGDLEKWNVIKPKN